MSSPEKPESVSKSDKDKRHSSETRRRNIIIISCAVVMVLFVSLCAYLGGQAFKQSSSNNLEWAVKSWLESLPVAFNQQKQARLLQVETKLGEETVAERKKDYQGAHKIYQEAIDLALSCFDKKSYFVSFLYFGQGSFEYSNDKYKEAVTDYQNALDIYPCSTNVLETLSIRRGLIFSLEGEFKYHQAVQLIEEILKALPKEPGNSDRITYRNWLADAIVMDPSVKDSYAKAIAIYNENIKVLTPLVHSSAEKRQLFLRTADDLSNRYWSNGELTAVRSALELEEPLIKEAHGSNSTEYARILFRIASASLNQRDFELRKKMLLQAKETFVFKKNDLEMRQCEEELAELYFDQGKFDQAAVEITSAIQALTASKDNSEKPTSPQYDLVEDKLLAALIEQRSGRPEAAASLLRETIKNLPSKDSQYWQIQLTKRLTIADALSKNKSAVEHDFLEANALNARDEKQYVDHPKVRIDDATLALLADGKQGGDPSFKRIPASDIYYGVYFRQENWTMDTPRFRQLIRDYLNRQSKTEIPKEK